MRSTPGLAMLLAATTLTVATGAGAVVYPQNAMKWADTSPLVFEATGIEQKRHVVVKTAWQGDFNMRNVRVLTPVYSQDGFQAIDMGCNIVNSGGSGGMAVPNDFSCMIAVVASNGIVVKPTTLSITYTMCVKDAPYLTCDSPAILSQPIAVKPKSTPTPTAAPVPPPTLPRLATALLYVGEFKPNTRMEVAFDPADPYHVAAVASFFDVSAATDARATAAKNQLGGLGNPFLKNIIFTIADPSGSPTFTFDGGTSTKVTIPGYYWEANFPKTMSVRFRPFKQGWFGATMNWSYQVCVKAPTREICDPTPYKGQRALVGVTKGSTLPLPLKRRLTL